MSEDDYDPCAVAQGTGPDIGISGCSRVWKSSLLAELERRGHQGYEEPGRQIVKEQLFIGGDALPCDDVAQFRELTISRSIRQLISAARRGGMAFFDRSIIDLIATLDPLPPHLATAATNFRYYERVFLLPP